MTAKQLPRRRRGAGPYGRILGNKGAKIGDRTGGKRCNHESSTGIKPKRRAMVREGRKDLGKKCQGRAGGNGIGLKDKMARRVH